MGIGATAGAAAAGGFALSANASSASAKSSGASDSLVFDKDAYTELTTTITDADGTDHTVVYHFWKAITYVASPVDAKYQSLNVSVPVKIDGKAVDATNAPIVFANAVGGYMPSSVADATGVGGAEMTGGMPTGGAGGSASPSASAGPSASSSAGTGEVQSGGNAMVNAQGGMVNLGKLGLAAGYVVVEPGARGRTLTDSAGTYYGTAPAAIVDLKAAVRYVRANKGVIPGNTDRIVSTGTSAGAPCPPCSARPATARSTTSTSRSWAPPTRPTRSSPPAPGAPSRTSSTPTARTSSTGAPTSRRAPARSSTRRCRRRCGPSSRSTRHP